MRLVPSAEQRAVIDHGLAPLRVAAGAGTGKTTTLALRVVALMDRFGVEPEQILGVTFTNKAAQELEGRVRSVRAELVDPARQVDVFTYHGFAAQLLQTHGVLVGVERGTGIITPTFSRQILLDAVRTAPFALLDITHRATITASLLKLAGDLADNLCRPEDLLERGVGDENDAKRHELAGALANYTKAKRTLGVLDYGDLIARAVELVERHPTVGNRVRERYRCVLLDEYQDTNPAQRRLFQSLFGDGTAVTAVGDPDQTIYEWRGATPDNFRSFPEHFRDRGGSPAPSLPLTVNRRSGQAILDLANRVREQLTTSAPGLDLVAADSDAPARVVVSWHPDARREAEAIAEELRHLHEDEAVPWSEMAVLFRKNKDIGLVRDALDEHEVPLQVANLGGLLGIPEIVDIHAWLRILANPEDGPALTRLLFGARHRLGFFDLAPLARWAARRSGDDDAEVLDHTLVEALEHLDEIEVTDDTRARLESFQALHRRLLTFAQGASLAELTREILSATGSWHEIDAMAHPAGLSARLNVHRFLDLVEDWSPLEGRPSLDAFLTYLELMAEDPVEELDTARVGTGEAVTLLTVHRAKGLEWDAVFVPGLYHGNFPSFGRILDPSTRPHVVPADLRLDPEAKTQLDPARSDDAREQWLRARHIDQEWRLAYVAATRARRHLSMSGAVWYGTPEPNKRPAKPSRLLEIARDLDGTDVQTWLAEPGERPVTLRFPPAQVGPDPHLGTTWDAVLRNVLDDPGWARAQAEELDVAESYDAAVEEFQETLFSLPEPAGSAEQASEIRASVTGLVTYHECPKRYYWSEVDRLPRRPTDAARRGVELHRRIELHNRGLVPFEDLTDDLYDRSPDDGAPHDDASSEGGWVSFEGSRYAAEPPRFVEVPFEMPVGDEAWVRGRVDAVYPDGDDGWEIVDFKSGRRTGRRSEVQLQAYALAAVDSGLGTDPPERLAVSYVYLGGGLEVDRHDVDSAWLERARRELGSLVAGIRNQDFEPAPSESCRGCDFLRFCDAGQAFVEP